MKAAREREKEIKRDEESSGGSLTHLGTTALTHSTADNNHDKEFLIFSALYQQHKILKAYLSASSDEERERCSFSRTLWRPRMLFMLYNTKKTQNSAVALEVHRKTAAISCVCADQFFVCRILAFNRTNAYSEHLSMRAANKIGCNFL
jgi:hypothetical protein